jgi:hypothetical protein
MSGEEDVQSAREWKQADRKPAAGSHRLRCRSRASDSQAGMWWYIPSSETGNRDSDRCCACASRQGGGREGQGVGLTKTVNEGTASASCDAPISSKRRLISVNDEQQVVLDYSCHLAAIEMDEGGAARRPLIAEERVLSANHGGRRW